MIGYIYVTKTTCGHYYVGQHKTQKFDESYFGSGVGLKGKEIEYCKMIDSAESFGDLIKLETYWIRRCKAKHKNKCLNKGRSTLGSNGFVFIHKKTNIRIVGLGEMKKLYRLSYSRLRAIMNGTENPTEGFHPDDWEIMTYKEYDIRRLNV